MTASEYASPAFGIRLWCRFQWQLNLLAPHFLMLSYVATPEEDGYIESFHSIVERELVRLHEWQSLANLVDLMKRYVYFYNQERLHGSLGNISPNQFARQ